MADVKLIDKTNVEYDIERINLLFPYIGNWTAHLTLSESDVIPSGKVTIVCYEKRLPGYVIHSGINQGRVSAFVVGGSGGSQKELEPKYYDYTHSVLLPISDMMSESGETLSVTSNNLFQTMPSWVRKRGDIGDQLNDICDKTKLVWRTLLDGTIFVGTDSFSTAPSFDFDLLEEAPIYTNALLAVRSLGVVPGQKIIIKENGPALKVGCVEYDISSSMSRAKLWFLEESGMSEDRIHVGLSSYIKEVMRGVDYLAQYPGTINLQRPNGTVDFTPESPKIPPMTSIPIRVVPGGAKVNIIGPEKGILVFEQGDPTKPAIHFFFSGSGGKKAARVDDLVDVGTLIVTAVGMGVIAGTYTPPGSAPLPWSLNTQILLKGKITTGSSKFEYPGD